MYGAWPAPQSSRAARPAPGIAAAYDMLVRRESAVKIGSCMLSENVFQFEGYSIADTVKMIQKRLEHRGRRVETFKLKVWLKR